METKNDLPEKPGLEDFVFANRNKAYGAYALRKKYRKTLLISLLITLTGVSGTLAYPFLKALRRPNSGLSPDKQAIVFIGQPVDEQENIPLSPPPDLPESNIKKIVYEVPIVVENAPEQTNMADMGNLLENTHNADISDELVVVQPPDEIPPESQEAAVLFPEEGAAFMNGDLNDFRNWIQTHVVYPPLALENGIFGKVIVSFCVDKTGQVTDVTLLRGADPALDQESLRVVRSSPLWRPARQGGVPVKQKFVIPVIFAIQ
jgi:protein TonB